LRCKLQSYESENQRLEDNLIGQGNKFLSKFEELSANHQELLADQNFKAITEASIVAQQREQKEKAK